MSEQQNIDEERFFTYCQNGYIQDFWGFFAVLTEEARAKVNKLIAKIASDPNNLLHANQSLKETR